MNKKYFSGICLLAALALMQGCATSYGRQNDLVPVFFKSNAPQATVHCAGEATELPGNIRLKRGANHDCVARSPGHEELKFRVWSKISGDGFRYSTKINWQRWSKWTLGLGHLFAWPVDFVSGSMKNLENDHYDLRLRPLAEVSTSAKVWDQTVAATQKVVALPGDAVEEVSGAVMNSVVKAPAEALGLASDAKRKESEQLLEGQAAAERLEAN